MSSTLYGLLVGINDYAGGVRSLRGCVNDVERLEEYLRRQNRDASRPPKLRKLLNHDATRAALVAGFREHLALAGPEDVVLFAFSGHGSQEAAPEEFWDIEPDHKNQTIVCYDSRAGAWDLADKELSLLLAEVAGRGCRHIVAWLDCCHAGTGTRGDELDRLVEPSGRPAPRRLVPVLAGAAPGPPGDGRPRRPGPPPGLAGRRPHPPRRLPVAAIGRGVLRSRFVDLEGVRERPGG